MIFFNPLISIDNRGYGSGIVKEEDVLVSMSGNVRAADSAALIFILSFSQNAENPGTNPGLLQNRREGGLNGHSVILSHIWICIDACRTEYVHHLLH